MRKSLAIGAIGLLLVGACEFFAIEIGNPTPSLTIIDTSFPSCELFRILDECNELLPASMRFTRKEYIVWMNEQLHDLVEDVRAQQEFSDERRSKMVADLERQSGAIEN